MKTNNQVILEDVVEELLRQAAIQIPAKVREALALASDEESDGIAKMQYNAIIDNINIAKKASVPVCQDTGIPVFYVNVGKYCPENISESLSNGVKKATITVPLRPNAVHPITRKNSGNNTGTLMPVIYFNKTDNEYTEITVMPKGAGSENMSRLQMLTPAQGLKGIKEFVIRSVADAGGKPCTPGIIGVGIGCTADQACKLAKTATIRTPGQWHIEEDIMKLEMELTELVNQLGSGPMGLGGKKTALAVHVEYAYCHTASLPVAISFQCWAARKAVAKIYSDRVEYVTFPEVNQ